MDRDVFVAPLNPEGLESVEYHWRRIGEPRLGVFVLTVAEVEAALLQRQSKRLDSAYESILKDQLPVIELDGNCVGVLGNLLWQQREGKLSLEKSDLILAAAAMSRNLVLATLRPRRFSGLSGLALEDWSRGSFD